MFTVDNTGTVSWKRILDADGKYIASLNELYLGDWAISRIQSRENITEDSFSTPTKAATWLWKNRFTVGEPFNQYQEKEKAEKKTVEPVIVTEEPTEDLFWDYKGKTK